jgi:hypothetical protein
MIQRVRAKMIECSALAKSRSDRREVRRTRFRCGLRWFLAVASSLLGFCFPVFANADPNPSPLVSAVSPNDGPPSGGTRVTITGTGFNQATAVDFGSVPAESFSIVSNTSIIAVSPPKAGFWGVVDITVTSAEGSSEILRGDEFGYGPIIEEMTPQQGPAIGGTAVTLSGFGLEETTGVEFGAGHPASFTAHPDGTITAVSPPPSAGNTIGVVKVVTPEGPSATYTVPDAEPANYFTYGPTITGIEPNEGPAAGGTTVTIRGSRFTSAPIDFRCLCGSFVHRLDFGASSLECGAPLAPALAPCSPVSFTVISDSEITATLPPGNGTVGLEVVTDGGTSPAGSFARFTYRSSQSPEANRNRLRIVCTAERQGGTRWQRQSSRLRGEQSCSSQQIENAAGPRGFPRPLAARLIRGHVIYGEGDGRRAKSSLTEAVLDQQRPIRTGRYRLVLRRADIRVPSASRSRARWTEQVMIR